MYVYTRMGSNKGKTPEHKQAKHTKPPHSLEWHNSTITIIFPSTLLVAVTLKEYDLLPGGMTSSKLQQCQLRQHQNSREVCASLPPR